MGGNMCIKIACLCLIVFFANSVHAKSTITFYRDGALLQQEAGATKGVIEIPLAAAPIDHSITITPTPGTTITGVENIKAESESSSDKELETLTEQRRRLEDRLQALETREAIFTAAAKSQSGKAPRKTKANPDPMQTIRQGTDFAIAQLEAVYTARRKTTQEIQKVDARLATARKRSRQTEHSLQVTVTPVRGRVTLRYATAEWRWQPEYNLHLEGDRMARLQVSAKIIGNTRGFQTFVSPGSLSESAISKTFPLLPGATVSDYRFSITDGNYSEGIFNSFSGTLTNNSSNYLPPGESGLFRSGAYLGKFRFEGLSSGRSRMISFGK
jgi:hypothetical protein